MKSEIELNSKCDEILKHKCNEICNAIQLSSDQNKKCDRKWQMKSEIKIAVEMKNK